LFRGRFELEFSLTKSLENPDFQPDIYSRDSEYIRNRSDSVKLYV
jgi:hypothetical protein